ncbi:MAG: hypothetical protein R2847_08480 [Bacteroidia bacterium]
MPAIHLRWRVQQAIQPAAAHLILNGMFNNKGVFPPELVGKYENCFHSIMQYLNERGVQYVKTQY